MCVLTALRLHDGNDRDELFLCLLRIKFWVLNLSRKGLDNRAILSYNTTPAEEGRRSFMRFAASFLWPHVYHLSIWVWPHIPVGMFLLYSPYVFSPTMKQFSSASTTWKQDHISIIRYLDLTTSLTIYRTGVHGDKMSGEYEKAVFA